MLLLLSFIDYSFYRIGSRDQRTHSCMNASLHSSPSAKAKLAVAVKLVERHLDEREQLAAVGMMLTGCFLPGGDSLPESAKLLASAPKPVQDLCIGRANISTSLITCLTRAGRHDHHADGYPDRADSSLAIRKSNSFGTGNSLRTRARSASSIGTFSAALRRCS